MGLTMLLVTVIFASLAMTYLAPGVFALDAHAAADGELWRLWTGHLVHWSFEHLLWDGLTFLVLAWLLGRLAPRALVWLLVAGSPLIAVAVLVLQPEILFYGGLSGLDVALWVALCLTIALRTGDRPARVMALVALLGGLAKVGVELASGHAILVNGVSLAPSAHVAGAVLGLGLLCFSRGGMCPWKRLGITSALGADSKR